MEGYQMKERGKTKFDRGWTRYNCLNKGYEVPDWAREPDETEWQTKQIEKHNAEVRADGRRRNEDKKNYSCKGKRTNGKRT
jgi:hypothetical protein